MINVVKRELMELERKQSSVKNKGRLVFPKDDFISFDHQYKDDFMVKKFRESMGKTVEREAIEMVDHPKHYQSKHGVEVIDIIEEFGLGFHLGNVIKYVLRAGHKSNELEDLEKAKWYLERVIDLKKTEEGK